MLSLANGFHHSLSNVCTGTKSRGSLLILPKNRFKRPFEFLLVADHPGREVLDVLGKAWNTTHKPFWHTSVLCLAAWIWARRRLMRFQTKVNRHGEM